MISNVADLQNRIDELETKRLLLEEELGRDFKEIKSGLTPAGFLKNAFRSSKGGGLPITKNVWRVILGVVSAALIKKFSNKIPKENLEKGIGALVAYAVGRIIQEGTRPDQSFFVDMPEKISKIISGLFSKNKAEA